MTGASHWELPQAPALIVGEVHHARTGPIRHSFSTAHYQWLVDVDHLPDFRGPLAVISRFRARDHLFSGATDGTIRGDVVALLDEHGITVVGDDRILMLAHARVFGHVFDPLSVFWCVTPSGDIKATVLEVHNTYGGRHSYLLAPDSDGRATLPKEFVVSPFNDTQGEYDVLIDAVAQRLFVAIGLTVDGDRFFTASVSGEAVPATRRSVIRVAARHMLITQKVSLLIRIHGVRLWLRGLPIVRPAHAEAGRRAA
ncbi:MAG: DUF1365 domain-containing protein [Solirubrobacterales bacterium]